jgi:hypothetical protein
MMSRRKRYVTTVLSFLVLISTSILIKPGVAVMAQEEEKESDTLSETQEEIPDADILLVYGLKPSDTEKKSMEEIVKTLTYLQHSVVYLPVSKCEDIVENYDYIICYNIGSEGNSFMDRLAALNKEVFFLGGDAVREYIKTSGYDISIEKVDDQAVSLEYSFTELNSSAALIRLKDTYLLEGDFTYQSGTLSYTNQTAGLYSKMDSFLYSPCYDLTNEIISSSFANETAIWMWPYKGNPHTYSQYLVLDEVYPFFPPEQLLEIVNYIISLRLPFVISVMPIYQNGDYPAMERFCEVLRYAQANGGAVILHAPNTVQQEDNKEQLWDYYSYAMKAYTNYGIYPLGIEVPEKFLFNEIDREIMERYTTIFCYKEDEIDSFDLEEQYNKIYNDGHLLIAPSYTMNEKRNCQILTLSTAAYVDITQDMDGIKEAISDSVKAEVPLKNLWDINQKVYGNDLYIYTNQGEVYFNDEKVNLDYTPFTYEKYKYKSGVFQWIAKDLTGLNHQLAFIVVISSVIFCTFIIIGRHHNRKRFLLPRKKSEE